MSKKSIFERAISQFDCLDKSSTQMLVTVRSHDLTFTLKADRVSLAVDGDHYLDLELNATTDVGDVCKFIADSIDGRRMLGDPAPSKLGGHGKEFEEALLLEAKGLEKQGVLTMTRYGTQVSMVNGEWLPVPSYPDFEGVLHDGRQFIIEAKVCSQPSFRMAKEKIKHKQVQHMLKRSKFDVRCFVVIHFNERLGATFYDKPMTVAIPVCYAINKGWEVWEQYAECKEKTKEFPSITRELAEQIGKRVEWYTPARSTKPRPDLRALTYRAMP